MTKIFLILNDGAKKIGWGVNKNLVRGSLNLARGGKQIIRGFDDEGWDGDDDDDGHGGFD